MKYEAKTEKADAPKFSNSRGVQNKEGPAIKYEAKTERTEAPKRFLNTAVLNKAAQDNVRVKAPTRDYLDADSKTKYKDEQAVEIEKPKFLGKNEGKEPHFRDFNKNEDVSFLIMLVVPEKDD